MYAFARLRVIGPTSPLPSGKRSMEVMGVIS
jgi:hypothetical protein